MTGTDAKRDCSSIESGSSSSANAASRPRKRPRAETVSSQKTRLESLTAMLEFWLSPSNLCKDKFLIRQMTRDKDGWIPAELFTKFNKASAIHASVPDIVTALSLLQHSHIELDFNKPSYPRLRVKGGLTALTRLVRESGLTEDERTVYIEPLPPGTKRADLSFIFEAYGAVAYLSIPTFPNGRCKGFAFVEFKRSQDALKVLSACAGGKLRSAQFPKMSAISRAEWRRRKEEYKDKKKVLTAAAMKASQDDGAGAPQATGAEVGSKLSPAVSHTLSADHDGATNAAPKVRAFQPGLLVSIRGLNGAKRKISRRALYGELEEHGPLSYIDFSPNMSDQCVARFMHESGAARAVASLAPEGGADVFGVSVTAAVICGQEEVAYWENVERRRHSKKDRKRGKEQKRNERRVQPRVQPPRRRTGPRNDHDVPNAITMHKRSSDEEK